MPRGPTAQHRALAAGPHRRQIARLHTRRPMSDPVHPSYSTISAAERTRRSISSRVIWAARKSARVTTPCAPDAIRAISLSTVLG